VSGGLGGCCCVSAVEQNGFVTSFDPSRRDRGRPSLARLKTRDPGTLCGTGGTGIRAKKITYFRYVGRNVAR